MQVAGVAILAGVVAIGIVVGDEAERRRGAVSADLPVALGPAVAREPAVGRSR
jgi:hypothetical protein